ncbi:MAG: hypothetical protein GY820_10380 [Gammaproteobacteria bacterium]|nr:hypothetical protein [Gammaproteobacteria bacterium]
MTIDISSTAAAFYRVEAKMEFLTKAVHQHMLVGEDCFMVKREKAILKAVSKIADSNKELLFNTFIGKLRHKLPVLHLGISGLSMYDRKRVQIIASAVVLHVFVDNGMFAVREQIDRLPAQEGKAPKFKKSLYVQLGGTYEKDMYKGIELEPGAVYQHSTAERRLTGKERGFLAEVASVPYCVWSGCTKELLMKGYSLKDDWGKKTDRFGHRLSEDPIVKKRRFSMYAEKITEHVKRFPRFYLSAKYDHRDRVYYDAARLDGIRPHGKLWETLMLDSADGFTLKSEDYDVLKHIIYVNLHGRVSVEKASQLITDEDLEAARDADPMAAETEKQFGTAILLNKAYTAIMDGLAGYPCHFMFGYDFTNSGLIMAGVSFKSKEMMKAGNVAGLKTVQDSHTLLGKAFGLDLERDVIKKLHTALLHGGTTRTLTKRLHELLKGCEISEGDVDVAIQKAYGPTVLNIDAIASWGQVAAGNQQSILRWRMPDEFMAASQSRMIGCPVHVYVASGSHAVGYTDHVIVSDMPLCEDNNGFPVFDSLHHLKGVDYPVQVKKRGLFADITHSIDAYVLRKVVRAVRKAGYPILLKHDDYIAPPGAHSVIVEAAQSALAEIFDANLYQSAVDQIKAYSPWKDRLIAPDVQLGQASNTLVKSVNFLMP